MNETQPRRTLDRSRALADRLRRVLPGGDTRSSTFYAPFPIAIDHSAGCRVWDVDGNEYLDFWNNYTTLVHGNAHPAIVAALGEQAAKGTVFPAPSELQAELAERIARRVPSIDLVRFTNSGSEAVMLAIRAARAVTGRDEIVKPVGGYHGTWDQVAVSPDVNLSIPASVRALAHLVPYNDVDAIEATMAQDGDRVAAIIMEPVLGAGGVLAADPAFVRRARELADRHGALLILDEIITLRLRPGGYQEALGVRPDLTTMGKIIGGGLPVGAVGGRSDVMEQFDPRQERHIEHGGTFNGNPLTMAAGCVSLDLLTPREIERINALGARLAEGLHRELATRRFDATVRSVGSLVQIGAAKEAIIPLHRASLEEGVFYAPRGMLNTSTAMDEAVIDQAVEAIARAAARVAESREPIRAG